MMMLRSLPIPIDVAGERMGLQQDGGRESFVEITPEFVPPVSAGVDEKWRATDDCQSL
jgi:hypothetical protein